MSKNGLLNRSKRKDSTSISQSSPAPSTYLTNNTGECSSITEVTELDTLTSQNATSKHGHNRKKHLKFYLNGSKKENENKPTALPKLQPEPVEKRKPGREANEKLECFKFRNIEDFGEAVCESRIMNNYSDIQRFLEKVFGSYEELVKTFKIKNDLSTVEIDLDYLDYVNQSLVRMPKDVHKVVLRSIINCMLTDRRGERTLDDLTAFLILLMCSLFSDSITYTVYSHTLRHVAMLQNKDHHQLITWFKKIPGKEYLGVIERIKKLINLRLFPSQDSNIPQSETSEWWIPNAVKVLALLNAANEQERLTLAPRSTFYIKSAECSNLIEEYQKWQSGSHLKAKRFIMQKDSETKMLNEARNSLVTKVRQKQAPTMGMLFLNLNIRRKYLLEDSLKEISLKQADLKKKLRVMFKGEPGIDLGGVSKEWFFLIMQRFFNEDYGMFAYNPKTHLWWFNASSKDNYQEYNLCGVLLGLAVYNGINLDIRFPPCVYQKLLSPTIVPYNNPHAPVGVLTLGIEDLKQVYPDLAKGLKELLDYEGDVEEDLCQTFQVSYTEFGETVTRQLKPEGCNMPVTNENRQEYVKLYVEYLLNRSIYQHFYSFYHGFHSVCASNALLLLRPEEVETLVIGNNDFNIKDLEKVAKLDGFNHVDVTIRYLWETVFDYSQKMQRKFLAFCTGSDRIPVGGMKEMKFKITRVGGKAATDMLPMAHTCFNQLCLPAYKSRKSLQHKLSLAVQNAEGFGLE